ncbi:MAG: tetratricopeptide repeat protein [Spirochaetia bacterium]|nr:tetratricopeptide repeat protein [Spirochaetia bacterium]
MRFRILILAIVCILSSCVFAPSRKEFANVYFNLGNAYMRLGEAENAAKAFLKAAEYDKKFGAANFNLAKSYIMAERYGDALDVLDGLAAQDPENSTILSAQAYCYYKLENRDKAFELYLQILEREPDNYMARFNYASLLAEEGYLPAAMETYQQLEVFSDSATDAQLYFEMAKVSFSSEDYEKSIQYGEKALSLDSENIEISRFLLRPYELGEYYAKFLETADVVIDYNLAKDSNIKNSENAELYFKKCDILLNHTGNFTQGASQLKKAIAAGFEDKDKLKVLYDNKELLNSDEIRSIIDKTGLLKK